MIAVLHEKVSDISIYSVEWKNKDFIIQCNIILLKPLNDVSH